VDSLAIGLVALLVAKLFHLRRSAEWICVVAIALLPNLDSLTWLISPELGLKAERVWLHGIPVISAAAVFTYFPIARWRPSWRWTWFASCLATLLHPLLDMMTANGAAIWFPIQTTPLYGDALPDTDPWIWGLCTFAILGTIIASLVNQEIGSRVKTVVIPLLGLASLGVYVAARQIRHEDVLFDWQPNDGAVAQRVIAIPDGPDFQSWNTVVETPLYYLVNDQSSIARKLPKAELSVAMQQAAVTPLIKALLPRMRMPHWDEFAAREPGVREVLLLDVVPGRPWSARCRIEQNRAECRIASSHWLF
jgi:membrane-bound metal-dependent hydrolase YbcI (DUF457 family)